jgi:hypothetical protein
METFKRYWLWILVFVVALLWYIWPARRAKVAAVAQSAAAAGQAAAAAAAAKAGAIASAAVHTEDLADWGGVDKSTITLEPNQLDYPGWYRTADGGWINYDLGQVMSPGTSPPVVGHNLFDSGEAQRPIINMQAPTLSAAAMLDRGYTVY